MVDCNVSWVFGLCQIGEQAKMKPDGSEDDVRLRSGVTRDAESN